MAAAHQAHPGARDMLRQQQEEASSRQQQQGRERAASAQQGREGSQDKPAASQQLLVPTTRDGLPCLVGACLSLFVCACLAPQAQAEFEKSKTHFVTF